MVFVYPTMKKTVRLTEQVLVPYIKKLKKEKYLPNNQKSLLIWDAFKAQSTANVSDVLSKQGIESVMVPKNMTYLLQPLDLTTMKLQVFNYGGTERKFDSRCHNNKSRLTTFRLEASTYRCHERGVASF